MLTWKITLEYDGTRYSGWQEQANARTITGELRKAAEEFFGRSVEIGGAGRTDAGVHALGQVAHLRLSPRGGRPSSIPRPPEILRSLNDRLPADINLLQVAEAHDRFHARHDAVSRAYLYQISTRRTALAKKYVWWVKDRLDLQAMASAAETIVGRHDFAAFSERDEKRGDQSTIVVVDSAEIAADEHLILFRISASHFLWKMVRRLVGTLVEVGRGSAGVSDFAQLIEKPGGKSAIDPARVTAPPSGLFLESIVFKHSKS
ncbi:MAG TPA: tRNA pseudouridine(38-40) synthase TruA [Blastocatellia bacterium]|nr:tRNA pseudouridine(38-40) synthase TruA [Blastocatellia bacterium]